MSSHLFLEWPEIVNELYAEAERIGFCYDLKRDDSGWFRLIDLESMMSLQTNSLSSKNVVTELVPFDGCDICHD